MVEPTPRTALGATTRRFAESETDDRVSYTPEALNRLIDTIVRHEVAGRLRERAKFHYAAAEVSGYGTDKSAWHLTEARELGVLSDRELAALALGRGEVR